MQDDFLGFDENPGSDDAPSTSTASGGQPPSARPVTAGPACLGPIATRMREFPPAAFDMDETYASKTTFRPPGLLGVPDYPPSTVPDKLLSMAGNHDPRGEKTAQIRFPGPLVRSSHATLAGTVGE